MSPAEMLEQMKAAVREGLAQLIDERDDALVSRDHAQAELAAARAESQHLLDRVFQVTKERDEVERLRSVIYVSFQKVVDEREAFKAEADRLAHALAAATSTADAGRDLLKAALDAVVPPSAGGLT